MTTVGTQTQTVGKATVNKKSSLETVNSETDNTYSINSLAMSIINQLSKVRNHKRRCNTKHVKRPPQVLKYALIFRITNYQCSEIQKHLNTIKDVEQAPARRGVNWAIFSNPFGSLLKYCSYGPRNTENTFQFVLK